jgi:hypothetical protein
MQSYPKGENQLIAIHFQKQGLFFLQNIAFVLRDGVI